MSTKADKLSSPETRDRRSIGRDQMRDRPDGIVRGEGLSDPRLRQPNERDEAPDAGHLGTDRNTDQPESDIPTAHADVERGLVDTERRGVPSNVPSSTRNRRP